MAARTLFCFGLGYVAEALARRLATEGWSIRGTSRDPERRRRLEAHGWRVVPFDRATPVAADELAGTTHVLTSVAPDAQGDPVLAVHAADLRALPTLAWAGYLGSTAVYGDRGGAWVDERSAPDPSGARGARRLAAEQAWFASGLPVHGFRLAGIYGPGRSALDQLRSGTARRIVKEGHVFSRIHVDDIASVLRASIAHPRPGRVYNVADDEPAPADEVIAYAAGRLGVAPPPAVGFEDADLSPMARSFYADDRRVSNRRVKEELGVVLRYPTYREGLDALCAAER